MDPHRVSIALQRNRRTTKKPGASVHTHRRSMIATD
jgi:hypothetical protein